MDAVTLIEEAQAIGLSIEVDGDHLHVRGPKEAGHIVHQLRANKVAVLAVLREKKIPPTTAWPPADTEIVRWFHDEGQHLIPAEPFQLTSYIKVVDPAKFREALLFEITWGPDHPRARTGALHAELQRLRKYLSDRPDNEGPQQ